MKLATIDVANEESLEKWKRELHLSRAELIAAINNFGPVVRDIRAGLLKKISEEAA